MNKLAQLVKEDEQAWIAANADCMNDTLFKVAEKASKALFDFQEILCAKRVEFESLTNHEKVDPCICLENAGDATGWTKDDVEFWDIAISVAQGQIDGIY